MTDCFGRLVPALTMRKRIPASAPVLRLANDCVASLTSQRSAKLNEIRNDYIRSFFQGFRMPGSNMGGGSEAERRGFFEGQEYRRSNPTRIKETMEGFGYIAVETEGTWTVCFEHSGFRPDNQPSKTWWLSEFGDTGSAIPKGMKIPKSGIHIRVTGFLSPAGRYGHLAGYEHELFATAI